VKNAFLKNISVFKSAQNTHKISMAVSISRPQNVVLMAF